MRLADFVNVGLEIVRDGNFECLAKFHSLSSTGGNLVFLLEKAFLDQLNTPLITSVVTTKDLAQELASKTTNLGIAVSKDPKESFYKIHLELIRRGFYEAKQPTCVSNTARVSAGAIIASRNVRIGENTVIEDGVIIKENVLIGDNCLIQSGTVLGNDCFEVAEIDGKRILVPHTGQLVIGNDVVVQSNCTISKGLFPSANTIIGDEVIVADMVHIAHGVRVGRRTKIAAGVIIAGNTFIGENVWIGPSAVISNGIKVGNNAYITLGSVVVRDVKDNERVAGNFAVEYSRFLKSIGKTLA